MRAGALLALVTVLAAPPAMAGAGKTPRLKSLKQHMWASESFAEQEAHDAWYREENQRCRVMRDSVAERACAQGLQAESDRRQCERHRRLGARHTEIFGGNPSFGVPPPAHCKRR